MAVEGDTEDFADIVGRKGWLENSNVPGDIRFNYTEDILTLKSHRIEQLSETIRIETALGNRFTFKVLEEQRPQFVLPNGTASTTADY